MSNARISKNATNKIGTYSLNSRFPGYSARQDKTTVSRSFMVAPSQNVVVGTSGRIGLVKGYTLDGQTSTVIDSGILSNYDFTNFKGNVRNIRAGFLTSAGNDGKIQFRYKAASGTITWNDLLTGLSSITISFCDYWDNTNLIKYVLWVDGSNNIYSWNGAVTTVSAGAATTITKQGTTTWQQEGFTATGSFTIGATTYTYTGGYTTTTLTGVSATTVGVVAGTEVHQTPVTTALSAMTGILATFAPTVIGNGRQNQVYVGSSTSNNLYISKVNNYTDYSFTSPVRVVGEGMLLALDAPPTKFIAQEVTAAEGGESAYDMWISEGLNNWAVIRATLSSDNTKEKLEHIRLKTSPRQAAQSERLVSKMKNHIMYVDNNNVVNFVGYLSYQYVPAITDFSYPIIDDMNGYNLVHGQTFFHKNYAYVSVPMSGLIRIYNMTDQTKEQDSQYKAIEDITSMPWFWEAPITYPIAGFYVDEDGNLGGHGFNTSESYMLFTGGSLNGQQIDANATFAYDDSGDRTQTKGSNELWVDGYIKQNTILTASVIGDLDAFMSSQTVTINGNDNTIVGYGGGGNSLGDSPLGSQPNGSATTTVSNTALPAYFHVIKTYVQSSYYLEQLSFSTKGVDLQWELISFGTNKAFTPEGNNAITQ